MDPLDKVLKSIDDRLTAIESGNSRYGKVLWSGRFASGTLTVPNLDSYALVMVHWGNGNLTSRMFGSVTGGGIECSGIGTNGSNSSQLTLAVTIPRAGNVLTYPTYKMYMIHNAGGNHGGANIMTGEILKVVGIA